MDTESPHENAGARTGAQGAPGLELAAELLAALPVGVACLGDDMTVLHANGVFVELTGAAPGTRLSPAEGRLSRLALAARDVIGHEACAETDLPGRLVARLFPLPERRLGAVVFDAVDRAALEASERRFEAFMDHSPAISFMTDEADRAVYLSRPYLETFGLGPEAIGRSAWDLLPPEFVGQYLQRIRRARDTGETVTECLPAPGEDGLTFWQSQYFRIPGTPGRLVGGVSFEVTELVRAREELRGRAEEQAALRRVATLVAREAPEGALFAAVSEEVGRLLGADTGTLVRFIGGDRAVVLGAWSRDGASDWPLGAELPVDPRGVLAKLRDTRRPARIEDYGEVKGALAELIRSRGLRSAVAAPIVLDRHLWGAVVASTASAEPMPAPSEQRIGNFAELVSQALANNDARRELRASRARIVQAGDAERRRLGRDLHDGAQQRLISLLIQLQLAREHLQGPPEAAREILDEAMANARSAIEELRQLAAGLHPAVLSQRGLRAALETLASRTPVPVVLEMEGDGDLPYTAQTAAYFLVAEALTNVAKHARASQARVEVRRRDDGVVIEVDDDGVGGADLRGGSGLRGLADRLGAVDGTLHLHSPPGAGTRLVAWIPLRG
jgi:PAS domain S-box-containing protein